MLYSIKKHSILKQNPTYAPSQQAPHTAVCTEQPLLWVSPVSGTAGSRVVKSNRLPVLSFESAY